MSIFLYTDTPPPKAKSSPSTMLLTNSDTGLKDLPCPHGPLTPSNKWDKLSSPPGGSKRKRLRVKWKPFCLTFDSNAGSLFVIVLEREEHSSSKWTLLNDSKEKMSERSLNKNLIKNFIGSYLLMHKNNSLSIYETSRKNKKSFFFQ